MQWRGSDVQDCDHGVPLEVVKGTALQEDVGLVDEDDCPPARRDVEHSFESGIEIGRPCTQVATADDIQRSPYVLARRLCGQGLSDTGRTEEVDDEPLTLALDEIVEPDVGVVRVDERAKEVLTVCGEHETFKRLVVPFDRHDVDDVEFHWSEDDQ